MLRVENHGTLAVAWNVQDKRTVERALRQLSPTLFLDPALDPEHGVYWTVRDGSVMTAEGPLVCLAWREPNGRAKPLTLAIVEQLKRQEGALDGAVQEMVAERARREQKQRERSAADYNERVNEHLPRIKAAEGRTLSPYWRPRRFGAK